MSGSETDACRYGCLIFLLCEGNKVNMGNVAARLRLNGVGSFVLACLFTADALLLP